MKKLLPWLGALLIPLCAIAGWWEDGQLTPIHKTYVWADGDKVQVSGPRDGDLFPGVPLPLIFYDFATDPGLTADVFENLGTLNWGGTNAGALGGTNLTWQTGGPLQPPHMQGNGSTTYGKTGYAPNWDATQQVTFMCWSKRFNDLLKGMIGVEDDNNADPAVKPRHLVGFEAGGQVKDHTIVRNIFTFGQGASADANVTHVWHHIAYTLNDPQDTHNIYVNGALNNSGSMLPLSADIALANSDIGFACINDDGVPEENLNGTIDDVYIHDKALTAAQVLAAYDATKNNYTTSTTSTSSTSTTSTTSTSSTSTVTSTTGTSTTSSTTSTTSTTSSTTSTTTTSTTTSTTTLLSKCIGQWDFDHAASSYPDQDLTDEDPTYTINDGALYWTNDNGGYLVFPNKSGSDLSLIADGNTTFARLNGDDDFAVSLWLYSTNAAADGNHKQAFTHSLGGSDRFRIGTGQGGVNWNELGAGWYNGSSPYANRNEQDVPSGVWMHIVANFHGPYNGSDPTNIQFFINATNHNHNDAISSTWGAVGDRIGDNTASTADQGWRGFIDELAIFNDTLTTQDMYYLYNRTESLKD